MPIISKEKLQELVELSKTVPEEYRTICFEVLLTNALQGPAASHPEDPKGTEQQQKQNPPPKKFVLPIDVKAFLTQYGLDETVLQKCFLIDGKEIRPIFQPKTSKKAKAQIQTTLLMALENAISTGKFDVEIEALRTRCQEQKAYDSANFMRNLQNSSALFKGVSSKKPLALSPEGKAELADLLEVVKD